MGFLNPFLYEYSSSFTTDITTCNNRCLEQSGCSCCSEGYYASSGWDPVSGLGVVDFKLFSATALLVESPHPSQNPTLRPTFAPTTEPTLTPTYPLDAPTPSPTFAPSPMPNPTYFPTAPTPFQYVLFNIYINETCYGDVDQQVGYLTNTCISGVNGSSIVSCTSQNITIQEFSTSDCFGDFNTTTTTTIDTNNCMNGNIAGFCKETGSYYDLVLMDSGNSNTKLV